MIENVGRKRVIAGILGAAALALGCLVSTTDNRLHAEGKMALTLKSTAFVHNGAIPLKYTCEGEDISPPLTWEGVPEHARSLVLIVDDPDAPDPRAPKMTWVHWVLYNIPPDAAGLPEGVVSRSLPAGTEEGLSSWKRTGYGGPCPPIGRHRYFHKLYALDTVLKGMHRATQSQVEAAMRGHIIAQTELVGTYEKVR
jgi:Raf kinase inhibitor-like YbhB/YbcL family protein